MAAKQLVYDAAARAAVKRGFDAVADAVAVTLGPRGRNVVVDKKFGPPLVTNDGVTIAREMEFKDAFENMGAQLLKEVASKTNDVAGDGTTTATVIGRALLTAGLRNLAAGAAAVELRRGIMEAAAIAEGEVRKLSVPVAGNDDVRRVASISAGDDSIGAMIAEAFEKVGREGVVSAEDGTGLETTVEVADGMQFDRGYLSPYLVTDQTMMQAVLEHCSILITDAKITAVADILPILEAVTRAGRPLLIVAEDIEGEALATLVVNRLRGTLSVCAVKAPGFGDRRKAMLQDLAILTGGTVVSEEIGLRIDAVTVDHLGSAERVTVTKDTTTVVRGGGSRSGVEDRCREIRNQIEEATSDWDREKLQERLARLVGGVALIKVGASTEVELKERKARVEDALSATRAALEEGVVPGGGVALVRAAQALETVHLGGDASVGADILRRSLQAPVRQIAENAGFEGGVVIREVLARSGPQGFDALAGTYGDVVAAGILDPTKVVVAALNNAASIAAMVLTTEVLIADQPEPEDSDDHAGHSHGMGMDGMDDMDF